MINVISESKREKRSKTNKIYRSRRENQLEIHTSNEQNEDHKRKIDIKDKQNMTWQIVFGCWKTHK